MTPDEERGVVAGILAERIGLRDLKRVAAGDFADEHLRAIFAISTSFLELGARPTTARVALVAHQIGVSWDTIQAELDALRAECPT